MKIYINVSCSGVYSSFMQGETVDVQSDVGKDLISAGFAEEIKATIKSKPQKGDSNADTI